MSYDRRLVLKGLATGAMGITAGGAAFAQPPDKAATPGSAGPLPRIKVHSQGHFLSGEDETPFFWLGDTAWQLIQDTNRDDCSYYLKTRARQGFTVIQTVALAEYGGVKTPTALGLLPFENEDLTLPNEAFFDRVAEIVDEAASLGMYVALVPAWGDKLTAPWGAGPRLFRNDNLDQAKSYAVYLARKLAHRTNVLWVLGGDRPPRLKGMNNDYLTKIAADAGFGPDQDWTPIWRALAAGLKEGSGTTPLIVYHPQGGRESSSVFLHSEAWLSMNGMQSGHGGGHDVPVWEMIARDYAITPPKPTLDLEPNYEDHPYNPWPEWDPATGYFRDHDVRKQVYRSVLAGGCGVTYGHNSVWQFAGGRHAQLFHADRDWRDALYRPAGRQMMFLRQLLMSRPYFRRIPDQDLVRSGAGDGGMHMQAARDREGTYAFVYFPMNDQVATIDLRRLGAGSMRAWWYDPRTGIGTPLKTDVGRDILTIKSPPTGPDWVLVLDKVEAGYRAPGLIDMQL